MKHYLMSNSYIYNVFRSLKENAMNCVLLLSMLFMLIFVLPAKGQIVINEFQPAPVTGSPEWIELYNPSTKTIQFNGYIHDRTTSVKVTFTAKAKSYIIVTRDTVSLRESYNLPTENVHYIEIKTPTLNNTTDVIVLRNEDSVTIDSLWYSLKNAAKGISFERVNHSIAGTAPLNLQQSLAPDSATLGYVNSHTKVRKDLMLKGASFDTQALQLRISIKNNGLTTHKDSVILLLVTGSDSVRIHATLDTPLLSDSIFTATVSMNQINRIVQKYSVNSLRMFIDYPSDERHYNNMANVQLYVPHATRPIRINEFLFEENDQYPEFVEITNTSDTTVSLFQWQIHDNTGQTSMTQRCIIEKPLLIQKNEYVVICADSTIFTYKNIDSSKVYISPKPLNLNNSGDDIVLRDPNGEMQDSLSYASQWIAVSLQNSEGISLEKISPSLTSSLRSSWVSCTGREGATPTQINSNAIENPNQGTFTASPNPFSPYPPRSERTIISYTTPYLQARLRILIYNKQGQEVRTVVTSPLTGKQGDYVWDGKDDNDIALPAGIYVLYLEAINNADNNVYTAKTTCVIGN